MSYGIEIEGLVKRYGETVALDGVDLMVPAATIWGLLGPNGAGKTTIVRILATLLRADRGVARVGGFDVQRQPDRVRAMIGLTGQFAAVDEALTGYENLLIVARLLELPARQAKQRANELLERFGLADAARRSVKTYSGGMRRRLDVAASLVGTPKVLFLDEPTTGLDPRARADVWELVRGLVADGTTVLLTTQYLEEADQLCHGVTLIDHGRVVRQGTPAALKATVGGQTLQVRAENRARSGDVGVIVVEILGGVAAAESDDGMIAAPLPTGYSAGATLAAVATRLESAGIEVAEIGIRLASLDEAFLALTGSPATTEALR
ncbi:daunorubicin resistance protein DrrA family ABC transporter ATP-binding protein [Rhizocola hellebori]|uniref:Daunorubicin resistance protein DrrA family ABC transporter ATP-binding protein n=1 Tax=Rhizocola hellebori TaxID=1392758 RepID=A0A8J3VLI4_9ACTN|nr:ATP-binding cassette domain-containing protein [Rhizocola hellebori]GIH10870.1 daunorubicin resistance protein DrrA family ABC transporter ATP-binding protein [Rhizocola hellebori]